MRQAKRRLATRERQLAAATELFAEKGFHGATLDNVAARGGYTIGAIYHNANSKEELFLATFERMISRDIDAFRDALEHGPDLPARRRSTAELFTGLLNHQSQYFVLYFDFCIYAMRNPSFLPFFRRTLRRYP